MKLMGSIILLVLFYSCSPCYAGDYPDKKLTPGVIDPFATKKEVCTKLYTRDVRSVSQATKNEVFARYGFVKGKFKPGNFEIDHFVSLELGGKNDVENLWPQKYCKIGNDPLKTGCWGARDKDKVETGLHREICAGKISLQDAQDAIRADWIKEYKRIRSGT